MPISSSAIAFAVGVLTGALATWGGLPSFPPTQPPQLLRSLPPSRVSHSPEIAKFVLAAHGELPHVTQIARAVLKSGQVAAENWHRDMAELFLFVDGQGIVGLDGKNFSVGPGSFVKVFPPTRHTIWNTGEAELELFSVAAA